MAPRALTRHPPAIHSGFGPVRVRGSSLAGAAYWGMVRRVALTAAAIEVGYILLFLAMGSWPLALVNVAGIAMYLGAYLAIQCRRNATALLLIWAEVIAHAALGSLLIGWDSGFHYYLLMFIPAIVIANTGGYAAPMVVALLAYYLGLGLLCDHLGPLAPLPAHSVQIVNWAHICIVFAMSAALADFYRRTILAAESRLRSQATRDALTELCNRSHFAAQAALVLERSAVEGAPLALLLCDVDHFKQVNDTHGHAVGDEVLVAVARVLAAHMRDDDVLARWGGEEFLALITDCPPEAALAKAESIRAAVAAAPLPVGALRIRLTLSLGVAQVQHAGDLHAAMARADRALYQAKDLGRNRVVRGE